MKKKLPRLIGLLILAALLLRVDWNLFLKIMGIANTWLLTGAFLLTLPMIFIKADRWRILVSLQDFQIKRKDAFLYYLSGIFMGIVTLGRIGELARALYLKEQGFPSLAQAISTVIADRLLDIYMLLIVVSIAPLYLGFDGNITVAGISGFIVLTVFIPFLAYFRPPWATRLYKNHLIRWLPKMVKRGLEGFHLGFEKIISSHLFIPICLTVVAYAFYFLSCFIAVRAFSLPLSYLDIIMIMAITNLISLLPISVAGLGTREATLMFILIPRGIEPEKILAFSFSIFMIFYIGGGIAGWLAWIKHPMSLTRNEKQLQEQ